jgi:ubiquinone/menaquinone biosynthesis C-methylase UbiE
MQDNLYDPNTFWDKRCVLRGHTGYNDETVYSYDQPIRLRAVKYAISHSRIPLDGRSQVLDIGCGVGDFIREFCKTGASISGIDISEEAISKCKILFGQLPNVVLKKTKLEEMSFKNNYFDLILSITVLQHIVNPEDFSKALTNLLRVAKNGAHILVLEISPFEKNRKKLPNYISLRTRNEWINVFAKKNCPLIYELSLSQIGLRTLRFYDIALQSLLAVRKRDGNSAFPLNTSQPEMASIKHSLNSSIRKLILACMTPFDLIFIKLPFPKTKTDLRLFVFRKENLEQ